MLVEVGGFHAPGPAEKSGLGDDPRAPVLRDHLERRNSLRRPVKEGCPEVLSMQPIKAKRGQ